MTLSGRSAEEHPDVDALQAVRYGIVTHSVRANGVGGLAWVSAGPGRPDLGQVDPESGTYRTAVAEMTETERREAGLRRNGRSRRGATT
ncbi:hypothetical protein Caci_2859 [Catenulispora acidiphila DSM 44928]|uniref:Uncharacterized protein n=1 Tax=Catenulispora acidiphila (strain DSM 44928 / JCM 14897 / NBRC 102108 / NRRL B-24433 / ID139908) TaxID=479433 RepID=C7Q193_CATAD|nr:hypothetical protein [Catenulispora acidiphila]ACU71768.1 hypothetical protein Caci_2859 [Catenulispora acidiphila DSM 44928]